MKKEKDQVKICSLSALDKAAEMGFTGLKIGGHPYPKSFKFSNQGRGIEGMHVECGDSFMIAINGYCGFGSEGTSDCWKWILQLGIKDGNLTLSISGNPSDNWWERLEENIEMEIDLEKFKNKQGARQSQRSREEWRESEPFKELQKTGTIDMEGQSWKNWKKYLETL